MDYEHGRRLVRMLGLAGRPPVMLSLVGEGHGGYDYGNETALWTAVAGFLRQHLDTAAAQSAQIPAGTLSIDPRAERAPTRPVLLHVRAER